jgi:hypothetical protein
LKKLSKKRVFILLLSHAGIALFFRLYMLYIGCPLKRFFGVSCPSCGMGRAHFALLRGHIADAFAFHPLFWMALPLIFLFLHVRVFNIPISKKTLNIIAAVSLLLLLAVYIIRVFVIRDPVLAPDFENSVLYKLIQAIKGF